MVDGAQPPFGASVGRVISNVCAAPVYDIRPSHWTAADRAEGRIAAVISLISRADACVG
jgi:hypothetical protein